MPAGSGERDVSTPSIEPDDLIDAVCRLPFRPRAVVVLRFYEAFSEPEIADALGMPVGKVKSMLHRALAKLKKSISAD